MSPARLTKMAALGVALAMSVSQSALACSVCFSAKNEENQIAYLATTGFLTFLPLFFAAGVMLWIRRRAQEADAEHGEQVLPASNHDAP